MRQLVVFRQGWMMMKSKLTPFHGSLTPLKINKISRKKPIVKNSIQSITKREIGFAIIKSFKGKQYKQISSLPDHIGNIIKNQPASFQSDYDLIIS